MNNENRLTIESYVRALLTAIGEDPQRPGLKDTPRRVARFWEEFSGWADDNPNNFTTFEAVNADQMITVSGIRTWSLCEHHLLPFSLNVSVGYIPQEGDDSRIVGLSKIPRLVQEHAHKLQTQENFVEGVAQELYAKLEPRGLGVVASGVHTCMVMRGIRTDGVMTTSRLMGTFRDDPEVRAEFFKLVELARGSGV